MNQLLAIIVSAIFLYFFARYLTKKWHERKILRNGRKYIHPNFPDLKVEERFNIHVNGVHHYMKQYIPQAGEAVVLKREPNNKYDMDAIAVLNLLGKKFGYIPANYNSDLASDMDNGTKLIGVVRKSIPRGEDSMEVVIKIVEPIV